jgi:4-amino-4-deoxy-L-arabinose transferase-like glycosyltransferase
MLTASTWRQTLKENSSPALYLLFIALLFIALFFHLGMQPLTADEPTRAVVAMEMDYSGNHIVSTINGEYYYKKPPLFNWIVLGTMKLTGRNNEFILRLTAVIPLLLFSLHLFVYLRRYVKERTAFLATIMFLTCVRMLVYDSILAHIDILYSWLTFWSFIVIYENFKKENYYKLFLLSYFLCALTFLLKGLPTFLFQGLTLAGLFFFRKRFSKLFSLAHLSGIVLFTLIVGGFFYLYAKQNSLYGWVDQLWDQSAQRTVLNKAWYDSFIHIFKFPVDHIGHLAPWSLLAVPCFSRKFIRKIKENDLVSFLALVLVVNIPVYWLSPGYYPRYLFMLYPIVFLLIAYAWETMDTGKYGRFIHVFLSIAVFICALGVLSVNFLPVNVPGKLWTSILLLLLLGTTAFVMLRDKNNWQVWLGISLLFIRIGFDLYVFPYRATNGSTAKFKTAALQVAEIAKGHKLFVYNAINDYATYYIERERNAILPRSASLDTSSYYIVYPPECPKFPHDSIFAFPIEWENRTMEIVKFTEVGNR